MAAEGETENVESSDEIVFSSTHEYVICGAGSAGCVLANRLSADSNNQVLLLEAGPPDKSWKIHMPGAMIINLMDSNRNWGYQTEPQEHLDNRQFMWPMGRVLGGSSCMHFMAYVRGHAFDYDRWEKEGAEGWSYADCLPYFKKSQTHELGDNEYRGGDGPLHISRGKSKNPLIKAFVDAGQEAGYPFTEDVNGFQQEGFGYLDMNIHQGARDSSATSYLRPAMQRANLTVETTATVTKILFEGRRAIGVEYRKDDKTFHVKATKEVIMCAGAIGSPQLLMLSGIGNATDLEKLGIPVVANLPGVGQNLQNHLQVCVHQECTQSVSLAGSHKWWKALPTTALWSMFKSGPGTTTNIEAVGFARSSENSVQPDIQFFILPMSDHHMDQHAFQIFAGPLRPTSVGTIQLKSVNPLDPPVIQPNYLSTEKDRQEVRDSIRLARKIIAQQAFEPFRGKELLPGENALGDEEIDAYIKAETITGYHASCTCKMGSESDPNAVVDSKTHVIGVKNLRVVDASIMPSIVSGNLNGPTVMLAEKAADIILENDPLPKSIAAVFKVAE